MLAMQLTRPGEPLQPSQRPDPAPGPGQVLIKVSCCGVCRTDLHIVDGELPSLNRPVVPGHEIVGRVIARGGGVDRPAIGERVGVPWLGWTCGQCEFCREENENLCVKQKITGVTVDGGFAQFVTSPESHVMKIPEGLASIQAAPLFCAGVTVLRALRQASISQGQRLAVFGVGGLGHIAVQIGCGLGAEVTAIDISEEKLALAKSLGASKVVHAASSFGVPASGQYGGCGPDLEERNSHARSSCANA
jgi:propanol-preferring alcohol dehydrogenase